MLVWPSHSRTSATARAAAAAVMQGPEESRRHAAPLVLEVLDLQAAQLVTPQRVIERDRGGRGPIARSRFERVALGRIEQLARVVVAERWLALTAFYRRTGHAFDRSMTDGVLLAEIIEH
jgi:hypothetical protein